MVFKTLNLLKELAKYQGNIQIGIIFSRTYMMMALLALIGKDWTNGNSIPKSKF